MASVSEELPRFDRRFFRPEERLSQIGGGGVGGKAQGLRALRGILAGFDAARFPKVAVDVPNLTVLGTDVFDRFLATNPDLAGRVAREDDDPSLAVAFQRASLPPEVVGDLYALVREVRTPLAVRSSSLLEDALQHPFAGVYATKMIPNNQPDTERRFRALVEAVKFVYATTFFRNARHYRRAAGLAGAEEKMACVIQEVVGRRHGLRFYPDLAGVARSYNFYPDARSTPADGVVDLALGLGRTIVDGGRAWTYSPAQPHVGPPFATALEKVKQTQRDFWAVNLGPAPYDPVAETEYLVKAGLGEAEADGTLRYAASTYDARSDRIALGTGLPGPRVLDFAPLLVMEELPLNDVVREVLRLCEADAGGAVELEFAATIEARRMRLACLQVRPMAVPSESVEVGEADLAAPTTVVSSVRAMGNGVLGGLHDVVYVRPSTFESRLTRAVAAEVDAVNRRLVDEGRPYALLGFGRWGSSDPWLGIPVEWGQIGGARVLVEATLPAMDVEISQGAHFFHNLISFHVSYLAVSHHGPGRVDWGWLEGQPALGGGELVRHVRLESPLEAVVDGRTGRGVLRRA